MRRRLNVFPSGKSLRDTVMRDTEKQGHGILIVDDDFELRRFLQGSFWWRGFAVGEADTGPGALTQVTRTTPTPSNLVLLDWTLPGFQW